MRKVTGNWLSGSLAMLLTVVSAGANVWASAVPRALRRSVVKIHTTLQRENYALPWQAHHHAKATGTGFIIGKGRILTNAHVVSDSRSLRAQKDGNPKKFPARVLFIARDCDLAMLTVDDEDFFRGASALKFAKRLPNLNDDVMVLGYPMGGARLSVTKGVVSRIDYSGYMHSGVDQHLVLQVDAAINPGNSGGPILFNGKVVGLAFQGISWAENIGYAIPTPVIRHFLKDIEDGVYHGYPELGVDALELRNPALRTDLKLPADLTGIVAQYLDPFGSATKHLRLRDVLLAIDGHTIANDGTVEIEGNGVRFEELIERKQWGASVSLDVWRQGSRTNIRIPLENPYDPFVFRNLYDQRPEYVIAGGLVFSPLTREYVRTLGRHMSGVNRQQLVYCMQYAKIDSLYEGIKEFVVLIRRLPHPVNTYADGFVDGIVSEVNGVAITRLRDIKNAMASPTNGFHVIRFAGKDDSLILDAEAARKADPKILAVYGILAPEFLATAPADPGDKNTGAAASSSDTKK